MMRILATTFSLALAFSGVIAQERETLFKTSEDSEYVVMPVNVSFFPGFSIGENVAKGKKVKTHVSWNILAGRAAKLERIELGWNVIQGESYMKKTIYCLIAAMLTANTLIGCIDTDNNRITGSGDISKSGSSMIEKKD